MRPREAYSVTVNLPYLPAHAVIFKEYDTTPRGWFVKGNSCIIAAATAIAQETPCTTAHGRQRPRARLQQLLQHAELAHLLGTLLEHEMDIDALGLAADVDWAEEFGISDADRLISWRA
jgi:hypothetical protein